MNEYISPSPQLIEAWYKEARNQDDFHVTTYIAKQAARWGFEQTIEHQPYAAHI